MTDAQIGLAGSIYLLGSVTGALFFGYATDRLGRKKLFSVTLMLYLSATAATAFSWNFASFCFFRALTGAGIGGEYAAINSAVDELIPGRVRGHVDLAINASFWIGAALGSVASLLLLNTGWIPPAYAWRFAFGIGAAIGAGVLFLRRHVPESPRWLMVHGDPADAEKIVADVEMAVVHRHPAPPPAAEKLRIRCRKHVPWREIWRAMAYEHRQRSLLGFTLMVTQAFFYNAVMFTYGLVLLRYYDVKAEHVGLYLIPLTLGELLRAAVDGAPLRHGRAAAHDRRDVHPVWRAAGDHGLAVPREAADDLHASGVVERDLLRRLVGSQLSLPDGQRDLSAGDPRLRDRALLHLRHVRGRRGGARAVRATWLARGRASCSSAGTWPEPPR